MSFVATGTGTTTDEPVVTNNGFWPDVDPADFREAQRIDGTVTPARVREALLAAVIDANTQLRAWQREQADAGHATADDVPTPDALPDGAIPALYRRAVYALAKASLVERYRDYDSTGSGIDRADAMDATVDDYRRDAAWAIADIIGRRRTTVELI